MWSLGSRLPSTRRTEASPRPRSRPLVALGRAAVAAVALATSTGCATFPNVPPLFEREGDLPGDVFEERALFGLASTRTWPDGRRELALRPLFVRREPVEGGRSTQVLTPFVSWSRRETGTSFTLWPFVSRTAFGNEVEREDGESDDDTWLFPVAAWGDEPGEGSYLLVLPVGGTLKGKFLSQKITTWAFPLFVKVEDGVWNSTHVLWPLAAHGSGGGREHTRVLPFWSQTDSDRAHSRTLLWPFVHWSTLERGDRLVDGWFVFPLLGHSAARDDTFSQWTALYPFFQWSEDTRSGDSYTGILWPVYKRDLRPGVSVSQWWWPAYGEYLSETEESRFYAWPVVWDQWDISGSGRRSERFYVVPLYMRSATHETDGTDSLALRSWPLFSWEEQLDGTSELRIPEISPVFGWEAGETAYGDLVTLFRWRGDAKGRVAWDGPLGLVRYRRGRDGGSKLTLLWWIDIPLGDGS